MLESKWVSVWRLGFGSWWELVSELGSKSKLGWASGSVSGSGLVSWYVVGKV